MITAKEPSFWDEAAGVLGAVAPLIGTAIGGPLAGTAARMLASALGLPDGTSDGDLKAAIVAATPDQLLALKKADQDFQVAMKTLDLKKEDLAVQDVQGARQMNIANKDPMVRWLAILTLASFAGLSGCILSGVFKLDTVTSALAGTIIGILGSELKSIFRFFYGGNLTDDQDSKNLAAALASTPPR